MRKAVALVVVGAAFVIAAVAGFVIVPQHKPQTIASMKARDGSPTCLPYGPTGLEGTQSYNCIRLVARRGLSRTAYDALRITTWALLIVGALMVAVGLIRYAHQEQ